jgi:hypothetical protein
MLKDNHLCDQIKAEEIGGICSAYGRNYKCAQLLVGKPEGERPPGRPTRRWENNIRMNLGEIGRKGVDWMHVAQDRNQWRALANTVMNVWVPYRVGSF